MSTDGENAKNQSSELDDSKPNLDSTDSSQDSTQHDTKSEAEDNLNKTVDAVVPVKVKDKSPEPEKPEKKEEKADKADKPELNDKEKMKAETDDDETDKKAVDDKENKKEKIKEENKKEKQEEKTDDDTEEGDISEEDGEDDDDKKEVPLLDQPLEQSGPRERKKVQRFDKEYTAEQKEIPMKTEIPTGTGIQLGDIARIDASISRFKTDDLKLLHKVLFKIPGKAIQIKKNIRKFNGFDFDKDSDEYFRKLSSIQKLEMKQLKSICEMLELGKNGTKDEIAERVCEFLLEPKDSGKSTGGGRPKRTAAVRANNRGYSSHEDADASDSDTPRSRSKRGKGRRVNLKDESSSEEEFNPSDSEDEEGKPRVKRVNRGRPVIIKKKIDTDEEEVSDVEETPSSDDSEEVKAKKKRGPVAKVQNSKSKKSPAKSPGKPGRKSANSTPAKTNLPAKRGRKKKQESSEEEQDSEENAESSSEDEPLVKKNKSPQPPTDEEIKTYVKEILEGANLEEITMKTVCKQVYAHYPDFDLAHKKDFIKTTVKSLIST